ncbi:hypothetical protein AAMO2058_000651700 [Amorphochlora amoebiformis]
MMRPEAVKEEIEGSLLDVEFACLTAPNVTYYPKSLPWMKNHAVQAIISLEVKGLDKTLTPLIAAACFPYGYALALKEGKGYRVHDNTIQESLSALLSSNVKGYDKLFQKHLETRLAQAITATCQQSDADITESAQDPGIVADNNSLDSEQKERIGTGTKN